MIRVQIYQNSIANLHSSSSSAKENNLFHRELSLFAFEFLSFHTAIKSMHLLVLCHFNSMHTVIECLFFTNLCPELNSNLSSFNNTYTNISKGKCKLRGSNMQIVLPQQTKLCTLPTQPFYLT